MNEKDNCFQYFPRKLTANFLCVSKILYVYNKGKEAENIELHSLPLLKFNVADIRKTVKNIFNKLVILKSF